MENDEENFTLRWYLFLCLLSASLAHTAKAGMCMKEGRARNFIVCFALDPARPMNLRHGLSD